MRHNLRQAPGQKPDTRRGFTIVELLIVIVVIGILAAITIVAYNGIQGRANDVTVQSDLANLMKRFEIYKIDNGTYPPSDTEFVNMKLKVSKPSYLVAPNTVYNIVPCLRDSGSEVVIAAISKSGNRFYVGSQSGGVKSFTGATSWTGTDGYTVPCQDLLPGSQFPAGACRAIGFCGYWRPWPNN